MRVMNAVGTLWILALTVLINVDIIGRNFFGAPLQAVPELTALSIVGIVYLQLADTLRSGGFTRAQLVLGKLEKTRPRAAAAIHLLFHLVGAALMAVILLAAWAPLVESIRIFEYVGDIQSKIPVWPIRLIMLVGLSTTLLCFLLLAWADMRRLQRRSRHPASNGQPLERGRR